MENVRIYMLHQNTVREEGVIIMWCLSVKSHVGAVLDASGVGKGFGGYALLVLRPTIS